MSTDIGWHGHLPYPADPPPDQASNAWPPIPAIPGQVPAWRVPVFYSPRPHRCPVCEGRQTVPGGFYAGQASTSDQPCRTCGGKGVLWR